MLRHLAKCPARQIETGITGMSKRLRSNGFLCISRHVSLSVLCVPRRSARNRQRDLLRVGWTAIGGQHLGTPQNLDALEESRVNGRLRQEDFIACLPVVLGCGSSCEACRSGEDSEVAFS